MRHILIASACSIGLAAGYVSLAAQGAAREPFKLGSFAKNSHAFLGIVVSDTKIADLDEANAALERRSSSAPKVRMPADMKELIERYDAELKPRLAAIAADVAAASSTPAYVYRFEDLHALPPVRPGIILNAGGNYEEHSQGIAQQQQRAGAAAAPAVKAVPAPGIWERKPDDPRPENPYLFIKSPTVVIGATDPIRIPAGRTQIDFECEFDVVIGRTAKHVPVARAADYIFGYTIQIDVSDRGGRGDRKMGGSDWLIGKNHDTFGPLGPYVVPKEFVPNPMNVRHTFRLNGEVMQDSNTSRMSHNIYELLHYASNILTLHAGDVISGGSPAGTNIERAQPRWMRAGDTAVCTVEGIGTQTHAVVADTE